jgi:hypothetical protein
MPRIALGTWRDRRPCQGVTEISMRAGRKENRNKSVSPSKITKKSPDQPAQCGDRDAAPHADSPAESGKPAHKIEFAPGTYYRQGVRVPARPPSKSALLRVRSR